MRGSEDLFYMPRPYGAVSWRQTSAGAAALHFDSSRCLVLAGLL